MSSEIQWSRVGHSHSVVFDEIVVLTCLPVEVAPVYFQSFEHQGVQSWKCCCRLSRPHLRVNARLHFTDGVLFHENISLVRQSSLRIERVILHYVEIEFCSLDAWIDLIQLINIIYFVSAIFYQNLLNLKLLLFRKFLNINIWRLF